MSNILKNEILSILQEKNWKEILCTTPKGTYINPYLEEKTVLVSAKLAPTGMFASEELCDELLKQAIIKNIEDIAKFVIKGVPMKTFVTEHEDTIGVVVEVDENAQITKTTTNKTAFYISKNKDSKAGFTVSAFSPVL